MATSWLLRLRHWVYSPIVHCHWLAVYHGLRTDFEFWRDYNYAMLESAHTLYLLDIDGWKDSVGVGSEIEFARRNSKPIYLLTPQDGDYIKTIFSNAGVETPL